MPRLSFVLSGLVLLFAASGCDSGPVGAIDREDGITAELSGEGITVTNEFEETIYVVAYGERALALVDPMSQTVNNPGRAIQVGESARFRFEDDGLIRSSDDFYRVMWITVKGDSDRRFIGPRGDLELER